MSADPITWTTAHGDTVEVYCTVASLEADDSLHPLEWRYRVKAANNRVVEQGSEGYTRRRAAVTAAERHHPRVDQS